MEYMVTIPLCQKDWGIEIFKLSYFLKALLMYNLPSPMAQRVTNLHAKKKTLHAMQEIQETRVRSLGWEYPLEKKMATH